MDWIESILQRDIIDYFKYQEFSSISKIKDHISDNSIQINIKFTFTVYEYTTLYEYILLFNYIYIYMNIYIIYILYIYNIYYIYINIVFFCLLEHCQNTYTRLSRWFHIHIIFSSWFNLIIVTSKNSLPNCEHVPSYQ